MHGLEFWCVYCRVQHACMGPTVVVIHTVWITRCEHEPGLSDQGPWGGGPGTPLRSCVVICFNVRIMTWPSSPCVINMQPFRVHLACPPQSPSWLSFIPNAAPRPARAIRPRQEWLAQLRCAELSTDDGLYGKQVDRAVMAWMKLVWITVQ